MQYRDARIDSITNLRDRLYLESRQISVRAEIKL